MKVWCHHKSERSKASAVLIVDTEKVGLIVKLKVYSHDLLTTHQAAAQIPRLNHWSRLKKNMVLSDQRLNSCRGVCRYIPQSSFLSTKNLVFPKVRYIPQSLDIPQKSPIFRRDSLLRNAVYSAGIPFPRNPLYSAENPKIHFKIAFP